MADKNGFPEYGELNILQDRKGKNRYDTENVSGTSIGAIRDTITKANTASEISAGPYIGVVLRVYENGDNKADIFTQVSEWFSSSATWSAKVRIPELHSHIPSPSSFGEGVKPEDDRIIEAHTTFRPFHPDSGEGSSVAHPEPGDYVRVQYKNGEGFIIETIKDKSGKKRLVLPSNGNSSKDSFKGSKPQ